MVLKDFTVSSEHSQKAQKTAISQLNIAMLPHQIGINTYQHLKVKV